MEMLKRVRIAGWKSIRDQTLELTPLTVVIGANGSGKSNLISLFKLLNAMFGTTPRLRAYVGEQGFADSLLHYGARQTPVAEMELSFHTDNGETTYFAQWAAAAGGTLIFTNERVEFLRDGNPTPTTLELGAGHSESNLLLQAEAGNRTAQVTLKLLRSCRLFHFHDTSARCAARNPCDVEANRFLYPDAGNLAAMLYLFREQHPEAFHRIEATVRQLVPAFDRFALEPSRLNESKILLKWTHQDREYEFQPNQLSDGSLRWIALATLLLQPEEKLPLLIALDEPELGLHPAALEALAGIVSRISPKTQLLIATQSTFLLDCFDPGCVVVVDSVDGASVFSRLSPLQLKTWLEEYSLGEIWEKNIIGGGPYG